MQRSPGFLVLFLFLSALPAGSAPRAESSQSINPHLKPEACDSCHVRVPTKEEGAAGNYSLLKESIDATCHVCHKKMCCDLNSLHSFNHRSDFKDWDPAKYQAPKTLPLQDGHITCATCHFHSEPEGDSYKMVRLVTRNRTRIEWSLLCKDCHGDK